MDTEIRERDVPRNFLALLGDYVLFAIGFAFYDPLVIVPAFVKEFTGSELLVGLFSALRILMITLPQLWAASYLVARPRKKPLLIWATFWGRFPLLLLIIATWFWTDTHVWLTMVVLAVTTTCFYISEALNGVSWPALVGKVIPDHLRGRLFGVGQLLSSLSAMGVGYGVGLILGEAGAAQPGRWALLFTCAFVGLMLSLVSMLFIREEPDDKVSTQISVRESVRSMWGYLRTDGSLRRVVIVQLILSFASAAFPFFVVRAREVFPGNDAIIGAFVTTQSVGGAAAALVGGYLIDKVGSWAAIRLGAVVQVVALLAVTFAGFVGPAQVFYFVAFFLLGFVISSGWWSFSAYLLDMATEEQRPIYLATNGMLNSLTIANPIIVGGLFELLLPELVFAVTAALSLIGAALAWTLRKGERE